MIHFNEELWNNHQLCVLQVLKVKETNLARKTAKNWLRQKYRDKISECHYRSSRQPVGQCRNNAVICRNKDKVELKLKV